MGQIGAGNSGSSYPGALDTLLYNDGSGHSNYLNGLNEIADSQTRMDAEALNDVIDAVLAIQKELGTDPSGAYATISARFASLGTGGFPGDPGSSTDDAVVRWDGTTGAMLQNSGVIINDANDILGLKDLTMTGIITATGTGFNTINGSIFGAINGSSRTTESTVYGGTGATVINYYSSRRARGTLALPTAVQVGDVFVRFGGKGHDGGGFTASPTTYLDMLATEAWNGLAHGSAITLNTTMTGTTTQIEVSRFVNSNVLIGTTSHGTSLIKGLVIGAGIAPTTFPADMVQIIASDHSNTAGTTGLMIYSESGKATHIGELIKVGAHHDATGLPALISSGEGCIYIQSELSGGGALLIRKVTTAGPTVTFQRARGTFASPAYVVLNDRIGNQVSAAWSRDPGNTVDQLTTIANIITEIDSIDAQNRIGGRLVFYTGSGVSATATEKMRITEIGNMLLGGTTFGTGLAKGVVLFNGTAPSTSPVDSVQLWSADRAATAGKGSLHLRTEDGTSHVFGDRVGINTLTPVSTLQVNGLITTVDLTVTGTIIIPSITTGAINATTVTASGLISGGSLTITGATNVAGLTASGTISGAVSATTLTVSGTTNVVGLTASGAINAASVTATGTLNGLSLSVTDVPTTLTNLGLGTANAVQFARIGIGIAPSATLPMIFASAVGQKILLYSENIATRNGFAIQSAVFQIFSQSNARIDLGAMSTVDGITFTSNMSIIGSTGNIGIGTSAFGTSATKTLGLFNGVAPTTSPADTVQLWSADRGAVAGKAGLHIRTEDGTSHVFSDMVGLNTLIPEASLHLVSTLPQANVLVDRYTDDAFGPRFDIRKARGTVAAPTKVLLNDVLSYWLSMGYARNAGNTADAFTQATYIAAIADPVDAEGRIGGKIGFYTSAGVSAAPALRMTLRSDGTLNMVSGNLITLNESGTNKYGLMFGGGNALRLFASDSASTTAVSIGAMSTIDGTTYTQVMRVMAQAKSVIIGPDTAIGTSGQGVLAISNGVAPTTGPANMVQMWSADIGGVGDASLHIRNEVGTLYGFASAGLAIGTGSFIPTGNIHVGGGLSGIVIIDRNDTSITFPQIQMRKSRGTYLVPTTVIDGDRTLALYGLAYARNAADTADAYMATSLMMYRTNTVDAQGRIGGDISWWTSSGVSASVSEKMYLAPTGQLSIGYIYPNVLPVGSLLTVANANITTSGVVLISQRVGLTTGNIVNGIDIYSNDSNLTQPGSLVAYIRAKATESHGVGALGTELEFAVTKNLTATPAVVMRLNHLSNVVLFGAVAGLTLEKGIVIGSGIAPTSSGPDAVQLWVADTDGIALKAGLHLRTEDGTSHVFGHLVGISTINPEGAFHVVTTSTPTLNTIVDRYAADAFGANLALRKARGTVAVPARSVLNDAISSIIGYSWSRNAANTADAWVQLSYINFVVDAIDVEERIGGRIAFFTSAGVSASPAEKMRITSDGLIGMGITTPLSRLHVANNDTVSSGVVLASMRTAILLDHILSGIDFYSNDSNLTSPGAITAYIRAIADEATHTATTLGTRMTFATTAVGAASPTLRMTLQSNGTLLFPGGSGQKINFYESGLTRYGMGLGSSQLQLYAPDVASARVEIGGLDTADGVTFVPIFRVMALSKNIILGTGTAVGTSGSFVFGINNGVAPTTGVVDMVQMWSEDAGGAAGGASLHIRAENGVLSRIGWWLTSRFRIDVPATASVTVPHVLINDDSLSVIVPTNAAEKSQINLPGAQLGVTFTFIVFAATGLRIRAFTGDIIRIGGVGSSASAGFTESTVLYASITLTAVSTSAWVATAITGTWTVG